MHASQTLACLKAGKHVQVEIPLCDVLADGEEVISVAQKSGLVAMCGHTRRFNPSHQWVHKKITAGEFNVQQMDVQTYFDGKENKIDVSAVDVSMNGIELQDREFFAAIREGREPSSSVAQVLPCYRVLDQLEQQLNTTA